MTKNEKTVVVFVALFRNFTLFHLILISNVPMKIRDHCSLPLYSLQKLYMNLNLSSLYIKSYSPVIYIDKRRICMKNQYFVKTR